MEVEIEVDPSPIIPVRSPGKRNIPVINDKHVTPRSNPEVTPNNDRTQPPSKSQDTQTPRERIQQCSLAAQQRMRDREMERGFRRITESIDQMLHSQYSVLNTKAFVGVFLVIVLIMLAISLNVTSSLPKGLTEYDLNTDNTHRIIASLAMEHLIELTNFGPKATGSYENEYLTVNFLKYELERIKHQVRDEWHGIDIDIQVVSGSFTKGPNQAKTFLKQTTYQNVQNVVAKLYSKDNATESILVNCHFDSVFTSPGTSDDGLNCAVMLEVLRVMSRIDHPLKRNVIFLFNGAEEDGTMGSHGFITQHKWASEIICFVNLDACGAGGRQVLFQTGPNSSVLPKIYSKSVPYPNGKVLGEEIFQSSLLPSGTDFSNFRDYGNLKGLDFAHVANGYVYHTRSDNISMITEDVIQLTGDNLLALLQALVDYDDLKEQLQNNNVKAIYYDIFGLFVICYSSTVGFLVNLAVVFISLYSCMSLLYHVFKGKPANVILQHVLIDLVFVVIGILAVTLVLYLLATLLKLNDATMLWYSHQWFFLSYYGAAVLLVMFTAVKIRHTFVDSLLNGEQEAKVFIVVIQFIMTVILSLGTLSGIRSSFILAIGLIGVSISHYFLNKTKLKLEMVQRKFITYTAINFVPALYCAYVFIPDVQVMIGMLGRMGADYDSEVAIWIIAEVTVLITFAYFIPVVLLVKEFWTMQYLLTAAYVAQLIFVLCQGLKPFSDSAPERFYAMHVDRKLVYVEEYKNESSGYLVTPVDIRGGENILKLFEEHKFQQVPYVDDCTQDLFCGMPTLMAGDLIKRHLSFWAPKEAPKISYGKQMAYSVKDEGYFFKKFHLTLNGSKFMDVIILPLNEAKLVKWSFNPRIPGHELKWNDRPVYYVRYHEGSLNQGSLSFSLKFDVRNMGNENDNVFLLAWSVFYPTNNTDNYTPQFKTFIDEFPSWSRVIPMVVDYEEYLLPPL